MLTQCLIVFSFCIPMECLLLAGLITPPQQELPHGLTREHTLTEENLSTPSSGVDTGASHSFFIEIFY